jgi:hypothetical protein
MKMPKMTTRLAIAIAALAGLLVLSATASAATNFGSRLDQEPANSGECESLGACTIVSYIHPSDPAGDPYSGGAPTDGVIVKFRIRAYVPAPSQVTFRLADIVRPDPNNGDSAVATAAGTGPTVTLQPTDPIETPIREFDGRLPVKKGQHLAIDGTDVQATYNNSGDEFSYVYQPPLVAGAAGRGSLEATGELLVAATIEPDADNDGFGDETQDLCPRQATTQGACDDAKPVVGSILVSKGILSYVLDEAATVTLSLEKKLPGRRLGNRCVKQTPKNKKTKKPCPRWKPHRQPFPGPGAAGANQVALPKLGPGFYRLTIVARDVAGNESITQATFKVPKKGKRKAKGRK